MAMLALSALSRVLKFMHVRVLNSGGWGTRFTFNSVMNTSVPADPAINLQKLNGSPPSVKGSIFDITSSAYPVLRLKMQSSGKLSIISF